VSLLGGFEGNSPLCWIFQLEVLLSLWIVARECATLLETRAKIDENPQDQTDVPQYENDDVSVTNYVPLLDDLIGNQ
jgi:hypothetical protein